MSHAEKRRIGIIAEHLYCPSKLKPRCSKFKAVPRAQLIFDQQFGRNRRMRPLTILLRILLTQLLRVFVFGNAIEIFFPFSNLIPPRSSKTPIERIPRRKSSENHSNLPFFPPNADKELKAQGEKKRFQTRPGEKILKEQRVPRGRSVFIDQDSRQIQKFSDFSISDFWSRYSFFDWSQSN